MSIFDQVFPTRRKVKRLEKKLNKALKGWADTRAMSNRLPNSPGPVPLPLNCFAIRGLIYRSPILRTVIQNFNYEVWREYPSLKPRWEAKCPVCGTTYNEYREYCERASCQLIGKKCIKPDPSQKKRFMDWAAKVNINGKSFWDISKHISFQWDAFDNAVAVWSYEYEVNELGDIISKTPVELNVVKPENFRLIQDQYGRPGGENWTCILHRDIVKPIDEKHKPCPVCGLPLYPVTAHLIKDRPPNIGSQRDEVDKRLITGEWFHKSVYTETLNYGISLVYTAWVITTTLYYMEELKNNTYKHGKPPKSFVIFNSLMGRSLKAALEEEIKAAMKNRNYIMKLAYKSEDGKNPAQVVNLLPSDQEMQTLEHEKYLREAIAILWGQDAVMLADTSVGGGLNNEGLRLTVLLRKVENRHRQLKEKWFSWVFAGLCITDWLPEFPPPKEMDKMAVIQRKTGNLKMIGEVMDRGGDIEVVDEEDLTFRLIGKIGKLQNGMGGSSEYQLNTSDWNMRDFQHKDASFAFSFTKSFKKLSPELELYLNDFVRDVAEIIKISDEEIFGEFYDLAFNTLSDDLRKYLLTHYAGVLREGVLETGISDYETDWEALRDVLQVEYINTSLDRLYEDARTRIRAMFVFIFIGFFFIIRRNVMGLVIPTTPGTLHHLSSFRCFGGIMNVTYCLGIY